MVATSPVGKPSTIDRRPRPHVAEQSGPFTAGCRTCASRHFLAFLSTISFDADIPRPCLPDRVTRLLAIAAVRLIDPTVAVGSSRSCPSVNTPTLYRPGTLDHRRGSRAADQVRWCRELELFRVSRSRSAHCRHTGHRSLSCSISSNALAIEVAGDTFRATRFRLRACQDWRNSAPRHDRSRPRGSAYRHRASASAWITVERWL